MGLGLACHPFRHVLSPWAHGRWPAMLQQKHDSMKQKGSGSHFANFVLWSKSVGFKSLQVSTSLGQSDLKHVYCVFTHITCENTCAKQIDYILIHCLFMILNIYIYTYLLEFGLDIAYVFYLCISNSSFSRQLYIYYMLFLLVLCYVSLYSKICLNLLYFHCVFFCFSMIFMFYVCQFDFAFRMLNMFQLFAFLMC